MFHSLWFSFSREASRSNVEKVHVERVDIKGLKSLMTPDFQECTFTHTIIIPVKKSGADPTGDAHGSCGIRISPQIQVTLK